MRLTITGRSQGELSANGAAARFHQGVEINRIVRLAVIFGCAVIPMAALFAKVNVSEAPPPPSSPVLLSFGNSQSYRGINTPSPDTRGNYWNSVGASAVNSPLTNAAGEVTTMSLGFDFEPVRTITTVLLERLEILCLRHRRGRARQPGRQGSRVSLLRQFGFPHSRAGSDEGLLADLLRIA